MPQECWLPVKGFEGFYEISNHGRVKSLRRKNVVRSGHAADGWFSRILPERILAPITDRHGRVSVYLYTEEGDRERFFIGRTVLMHFKPRKDMRKLVTVHIDRDKSNNHVDNLKWAEQRDAADYMSCGEFYNKKRYVIDKSKFQAAQRMLTEGRTQEQISGDLVIPLYRVGQLARGEITVEGKPYAKSFG